MIRPSPRDDLTKEGTLQVLATRLPIVASTFPALEVVLFRVGAAAYAALRTAVARAVATLERATMIANTCRARTVGHGEIYRGKQVGVRCCGDAK